jgi:hypothetical protein
MMTDDDLILMLRTLEPPPELHGPDLGPLNAHVRRRRNRRRTFGAAAVLGVVAAGIAIPVTTGSGSDVDRLVPARPAPSEQLAAPGSSFAAAAPVVVPFSGPAAMQRPPCSASAIKADATTTRGANGVLGLISITGTGCSLHLDTTRMRLVDSEGTVVAATNKPPSVNPGLNGHAFIPEANGSVSIGFAWSGSFCGTAPAIEMPALPEVVRIPIQGATPECDKAKAGRLIPGVVGYPGQPVEPAPADWQALRARLNLPSHVSEGPISMSVTITNPSDKTISLAAPCPAYTIILSFSTETGRGLAGASAVVGSGGNLCDTALELGPGQSVTQPIPDTSYARESPWKVGSQLTAQWAMAGVPTATATAEIVSAG